MNSKPSDQRSERAPGRTGYTRIERAVMEALAHELRQELPDLADQFGSSRPNIRRNTGYGLVTEMVAQRPSAAAPGGPTGDLGSVHVMLDDLPDPLAFRARVRNGLLLGLIGDSYGQDTRGIDFDTARFDQVFTIDHLGRSVPAPAPQPLTSDPPVRPATTELAQRRPQEPALPADLAPPPRPPAPSPARFTDPGQSGWELDDRTLRLALQVLVVTVGLVAVLVFDLSPFLALLLGFGAFRALRSPRAMAVVRRLVDQRLRPA